MIAALPQFNPFAAPDIMPCVPRNYYEQLMQQQECMTRALLEFIREHCQRYQNMPVCPQPNYGMNVTKNTGTEATLQSGSETFGFNKSEQGFSITDSNGKTTKIWGDPHYQNADGSNAADIHGDTVTTLSDGTRVFVKTSNAQGERDHSGAATYAKSVAIVRPDGSTAFIDNIVGDKPLEVKTPPYGQAPLDFVREKMGGDFKPEAFLSIDSQGRWTDMRGKPLTQASADAMAQAARSQGPLAAALASGCFEGGLFPRSLWENPEFQPTRRNSQYYSGMQQLQQFIEQALQGNGLSQLAMCGPEGNMLLQLIGAGMAAMRGNGNGNGNGNGSGSGYGSGLGGGRWDGDPGFYVDQPGQGYGGGYGSAYGGNCGWLPQRPIGECIIPEAPLPICNKPGVIGSIYGGCERPERMTSGYAAAILADHFEKNPLAAGRWSSIGYDGSDPLLHDVIELRSSDDPRLKAAADFLMNEWTVAVNGDSAWKQIAWKPGHTPNVATVQDLRAYAQSQGYGDARPLSQPYRPFETSQLGEVFGAQYMQGGQFNLQQFIQDQMAAAA